MSKDHAVVDWKAIRRDVLANIQSGRWQPGSKLPREIELAQHYGCTRSTVGRALRDLAEAGFLDRKRKGGTTVAANPMRKAPLDMPILRDAIASAGQRPDYRMLQAGLQDAPSEISAALGQPPGTELLHIKALYRADGHPHQLEDRWLVPAMVPGLGADHWATDPVDEWLLCHAPLTRAQIEIESVSLSEALAILFDQPPGSPALRITRISWKDENPLGILRLYHAPGYRLRTAI